MEGSGLVKTVYYEILGDTMKTNVKQLGLFAGNWVNYGTLASRDSFEKKLKRYFQFNFAYI